ncbi:hypothetical protein OIU74_020449 [Salix koriyanagi]|uniref:Uncharacterized protein n=1 Tax=Salix koriyanagi TaxID=2511006 RepID=A0A9Q0SLI4_9ROSI|nr:hypothetical protein OIU74_020449 [Salix koriyanagi]
MSSHFFGAEACAFTGCETPTPPSPLCFLFRLLDPLLNLISTESGWSNGWWLSCRWWWWWRLVTAGAVGCIKSRRWLPAKEEKLILYSGCCWWWC